MIDNRTKKVLIMTVGTGANGLDIAHGLVFSIRDSNPDLIILIGSLKSFESTLPHIKSLMAQESINPEVNEKLIEEVNDFEILHFKYSAIINELLNQGYLLNNISVDYTSGTKAMSAALVSAAIESRVGTLSYIHGERGEGGRVKSGTERRSSFPPNKYYSKKIFEKAVELFNSHRYQSSIDLLTYHEFHPEYQSNTALFIKLSQMFDAWDKFNFNLAFSIAKVISSEDLKVFNLKGKFEKEYIPALLNLKEKKVSFEMVFDLIENARRRAIEDKYDDAIARLYRSLEMIGQIEFENEFSCSTANVILENIPEKLHQEISSKYFDEKDSKIKLPMYATFYFLKCVNNKSGEKFFKQYDLIKKILHLRNNSILAHGIITLNQKEYDEALSMVVSFIADINLTQIPKLPSI